jgi:hypothetical protein
MRLNLHARIEIAVVAVLLLGSCDQTDWEDRLSVADANGRNAIYKVNELESRVEDIEDRLNM